MKVVLATEAQADLEDIGDTIAADNPDRALTFVQAPQLRRTGAHAVSVPFDAKIRA